MLRTKPRYGWTASPNGNAVFYAFSSKQGAVGGGPFAKLSTITVGAEIQVQLTSEPLYKYHVVRLQRFDKATIEMTAVLFPMGKAPDRELITLPTDACSAAATPTAQFGNCQ